MPASPGSPSPFSAAPSTAEWTAARSCDLAQVCSGCGWLGTPYHEQLERKRAELRLRLGAAQLPTAPVEAAQILSIAADGLRDRVDLSLRRIGGDPVVLGLHDVERQRVVDIHDCPAMSPALAAWHAELRRSLPPVPSAAMRLRVGPDGQRGVWIDTRREVLAALVADGDWLAATARHGAVELGQRHQRVIPGSAGVELGDAQLAPWFETYLGPGQQPTPLFTTIGSFTQPGFRANRALVAQVMAAVVAVDARTWLELGSGCGNFTLPLASLDRSVVAVDLDPIGRAGLARSLEAYPELDVTLALANLRQPSSLVTHLAAVDAVLVDPPRSGLMEALVAIAEADPRPRHIVYVACVAATLARDARRLHDLGYRLRTLRGVDLFPQSEHCEWIATLARD